MQIPRWVRIFAQQAKHAWQSADDFFTPQIVEGRSGVNAGGPLGKSFGAQASVHLAQIWR